MTNLVPLQNLEAFIFHEKTIGEPLFKRKLCVVNHDKLSEFKNSGG